MQHVRNEHKIKKTVVSKQVRTQTAAVVSVSLSPRQSAASANCRPNTRSTHLIK